MALHPAFISPPGSKGTPSSTSNPLRSRREERHHYLPGLDHNATLLGDDLYAHQPFCRRVLLQRYHFIFVCKTDSHLSLYQWVGLLETGRELRTVTMRVKNKGHWETHTYRYAHGVPLVEGEGALKVNWCEVTITDKGGEVRYHNAFITDWKITDENVAALVATGRARWKIENENNNTLKTKGYHLEHNFGHGKKYLSSLLAAMNMLALLTHTFLAFCDESYQLIRATLPTRKTFFDDIRALLRYHCFLSWEAMMDFMMRGLEIGPYTRHPQTRNRHPQSHCALTPRPPFRTLFAALQVDLTSSGDSGTALYPKLCTPPRFFAVTCPSGSLSHRLPTTELRHHRQNENRCSGLQCGFAHC